MRKVFLNAIITRDFRIYFGRDCTITPMCGLLGGMDEKKCMFHSIAYVCRYSFIYQLFR